jgi:hypothetical protein
MAWGSKDEPKPCGPPAAHALVRDKASKLLVCYIDTSHLPSAAADAYVGEWKDRYAGVAEKLPSGWAVLFVPTTGRTEITTLDLT